MARIKCPKMLCGSKDVTMIGARSRTSINLNPLHPFTVFNNKAAGKQKFRFNKCGKVFKAKI